MLKGKHLDLILRQNMRAILSNAKICPYKKSNNCGTCKSCDRDRHMWRYFSQIEQRCDHCGAQRPMPEGF